jgi:metal-sulfur cluster biosynthetic enzyme
MAAIDEACVRDALKGVIDPEIGIDVIELGLVYGIELGAGGVRVRMTLTSAACPMGESLREEAEQALSEALPAGTAATVELVWDPPWSPERMSERAKRSLGWQP